MNPRERNPSMLASDDDSRILERASYAAYSDAVKTAYGTLSDSVAQYFNEHREFHDREILPVPNNFRPLRDYERTLKILKLTLQLALRTADQIEHEPATFPANGDHPSPVSPAASRGPEPRQAS
jgi:hypothetical protein